MNKKGARSRLPGANAVMNQLPVCGHFVAAKGAGTSIGATVQVWTNSLRPGMEILPCRGGDDAARNWFCFAKALSGFVDPYRFDGYMNKKGARGKRRDEPVAGL